MTFCSVRICASGAVTFCTPGWSLNFAMTALASSGCTGVQRKDVGVWATVVPPSFHTVPSSADASSQSCWWVR